MDVEPRFKGYAVLDAATRTLRPAIICDLPDADTSPKFGH